MATIRDVARESNVSIATVSRVFNNSPLVRDDTRERVVAAAARLGYWPNAIARSLITNRTHAVGVLLPDLHGEFFSEVIHGMDRAAREHGMHLLVSRARTTPVEFTVALRSMRGRIDALVIMAPDVDSIDELAMLAGDVPMVLMNSEAEVPGADTISVDNFEGSRAVVEHLVRLGHRRIAIIAGPEHNVDAVQRLDGYRAALKDAGLEVDAALEIHGDFTEPSGYVSAQRLLERDARPTAVFVANDHMAIGVLGALEDARVSVPSELAVVGFDDIPMARYLTPPLTTVHVDIFRMGQRAMELLLERSPNGDPALGRREVLPTTLVVRSSCGATPPAGTGARPAWDRRRAAGSTRR